MKLSIGEARYILKDLVDLARSGLEVIIIDDDDQPAVRLVAVNPPKRKPREPGGLKGTVLYMAPDFDAPLEEFKEYMP